MAIALYAMLTACDKDSEEPENTGIFTQYAERETTFETLNFDLQREESICKLMSLTPE